MRFNRVKKWLEERIVKMATTRLSKSDKVILNSDQGSQYSSYEYKTFANKNKIALRVHSYLDYISPNEFEKRYNLESLKK